MFRRLFGIFKRKKKDQPQQAPGQASTGEAIASVPTAGVAVGAGVGAAQPGDAISQTNPVPEGLVSESQQDTSGSPSPDPQPAPEVNDPVSEPPAVESAPPTEETPSEPVPQPPVTEPTDPAPTDPAPTDPTDDPTGTPGLG